MRHAHLEQLQPSEQFWARCEPWLKEKGYGLRPRYRPGWVASWKDSDLEPSGCEDGQAIEHGGFLDGEKLSDGSIVFFKKLPASDIEVEMNRLLATLNTEDPRNHCVLPHEILEVPNDVEADATALLVLPFMTRWHDPEFSTAGEVLDFFQQLCEGLDFLHENGIVHNDIKFNNVMMDSRNLCDQPIHPVKQIMARDWSHKVQTHTRTDRPVKYYFIDFGLAQQYSSGKPREREPGYGGDTTVPEFKRKESCDPFAVDVYRLGNLIKECLLTGTLSAVLFPKRKGLEFLNELITDMTQPDPAKRPTIREVISRLGDIRKGLSWRELRAPIPANDDHMGVKRRSTHWRKQLANTLKGKSALPTDG
ncbi:hypothetical protein PM082_000221 [Marasmius tenuissimus]|nr:hypothetical protein PM082_000221 [Marasmius tenuissimus]